MLRWTLTRLLSLPPANKLSRSLAPLSTNRVSRNLGGRMKNNNRLQPLAAAIAAEGRTKTSSAKPKPSLTSRRTTVAQPSRMKPVIAAKSRRRRILQITPPSVAATMEKPGVEDHLHPRRTTTPDWAALTEADWLQRLGSMRAFQSLRQGKVDPPFAPFLREERCRIAMIKASSISSTGTAPAGSDDESNPEASNRVYVCGGCGTFLVNAADAPGETGWPTASLHQGAASSTSRVPLARRIRLDDHAVETTGDRVPPSENTEEFATTSTLFGQTTTTTPRAGPAVHREGIEERGDEKQHRSLLRRHERCIPCVGACCRTCAGFIGLCFRSGRGGLTERICLNPSSLAVIIDVGGDDE